MSIEDKIREVAQKGWPSHGFVLEDWEGVDRAVDKTDLPAIVCFLVEDGTLEFKNGRCKDSEDLILAFIDKVPRDADGDEHKSVFLSMKGLAKDFIAALSKCGYFEPINQRITYHSLYEVLASNVSGLWCRITLKELQGVCV